MIEIISLVFFAFIGFPLSSQVFDDTKLRPRYRQWTRWDECTLFWQKKQYADFIVLQSQKSCGTLY